MHMYHDTHGSLPPGGKGDTYGTWLAFIMPYLEQTALGNSFNFAGGPTVVGEGVLRYSGNANITVTSTRVNAYMCPSDGGNTFRTGVGATFAGIRYNITSQNYVVNWGNLSAGQPSILLGVPFGGAPFTDFLKNYSGPGGEKVVGFHALTDGLSSTMLVSECIVTQGNNAGQYNARWDYRGFSWWRPAAGYVGWLTPNSSQPDVTPERGQCIYPYQDNPPCTAPTSALPYMFAARSRHPGGVNVTMGDGSVKFIKNSINV
ncbi:MAG: DUF1559 domain-containing protein, partial [Singulisphaera sp.]